VNGISYKPGYIFLHRTGELRERGEILWEMMRECRLCPRECRVNRLEGETGTCGATSTLRVASYGPHYGEEKELVGVGGSGTIFFSHCNLRCVFCQNWDISHKGDGLDCSVEDLANMMLELQERSVSNINIVTPTHYAPHLILALDIAASRGLKVPLVYNTSGWERLDVLQQLDRIVDIYLADFKYTDPEKAFVYSAGAGDYPHVCREALIEMNRQVGVARPERNGVIFRGLMIRHLVMPGDASGSLEAIRWIADHLPASTYLNIMQQYRPALLAQQYHEIDRPVTMAEYNAVVTEARRCGLDNLGLDH
jgi:putative pyruvate formate lyase activating enzyme